MDAAYSYLRAQGLAVHEPKIAHYGMKQLHLHDPDGFNICFQWSAEAQAPRQNPTKSCILAWLDYAPPDPDPR